MKTIKIFLLIVGLTLTTQYSFAQKAKIKIKDRIATVDGVPYLKVSDCGTYDEDCSISNLSGKELVSIDNLKDPRAAGMFMRITFKGLNTTIEARTSMWGVVEMLYGYNVVDEAGNLVPEQVKLLLKKYGNNISLKDSEED